jgi:hypothetical protein
MSSDPGRLRWWFAAGALLAAVVLAVVLPHCAAAPLDRITVTTVVHPGPPATAAVSGEGR